MGLFSKFTNLFKKKSGGSDSAENKAAEESGNEVAAGARPEAAPAPSAPAEEAKPEAAAPAPEAPLEEKKPEPAPVASQKKSSRLIDDSIRESESAPAAEPEPEAAPAAAEAEPVKAAAEEPAPEAVRIEPEEPAAEPVKEPEAPAAEAKDEKPAEKPAKAPAKKPAAKKKAPAKKPAAGEKAASSRSTAKKGSASAAKKPAAKKAPAKKAAEPAPEAKSEEPAAVKEEPAKAPARKAEDKKPAAKKAKAAKAPAKAPADAEPEKKDQAEAAKPEPEKESAKPAPAKPESDSVKAPAEPEKKDQAKAAEAEPEKKSAKEDNDEEPQSRFGLFRRLVSGLSNSGKSIGYGLSALFRGRKIDEDLYNDLEERLVTADISYNTAEKILERVREKAKLRELRDADALTELVKAELLEILRPVSSPLIIQDRKPFVILMVGVNGAGKTTTIGKMASAFKKKGMEVVLAAGDTFRAAAVEQLNVWGVRNDVRVVSQATGSDAASVIFDAYSAAKASGADVLIADTAGRLQNKENLMKELAKIVKVIKKHDPDAPHEVLITLDAGIGQNAISQVRQFNSTVPVTGICLTKLDGTAKGGVIFTIADEFRIPVRYIGVGEGISDLREFNAGEFIDALFDGGNK
jgi:fused signal recognition particle receptor